MIYESYLGFLYDSNFFLGFWVIFIHPSDTATNQVWKYTPDKKEWTQLANLPYPNYGFRLVSLNEYIYMFGTSRWELGWMDGSEVYKLDPKASEEWEKVGTLNMDHLHMDSRSLVVIPFIKDSDSEASTTLL